MSSTNYKEAQQQARCDSVRQPYIHPIKQKVIQFAPEFKPAAKGAFSGRRKSGAVLVR